MIKYFSLILTYSLLSGLVQAAPEKPNKNVNTLSKLLLTGKPLTVEQRKLLAVTSLHHYEAIKRALVLVKLGGTEKESAQAKSSLNMLKKDEAGMYKSSMFGATIGWYLFFDKGSITTIPLIVKVEEESAAAKAGLLPGDVIDTCAGVALKCESSRNKFAHFIHQWPPSQPLTLHIRRSQNLGANSNRVKRIKKTLSLFAKDPAE